MLALPVFIHSAHRRELKRLILINGYLRSEVHPLLIVPVLVNNKLLFIKQSKFTKRSFVLCF